MDITSEIFEGNPQDTDYYSLAYSIIIGEYEAPYVRLLFGEMELGTKSYVMIKSIYDNKQMTHTSSTLDDWNNSTMFFNGDSILVELYLHRNDDNVQIELLKLFVGEIPDNNGVDRTICGTDNRISSSNDAIGRIFPVGCTAWIANNGKLVSAGHCVYYSEIYENGFGNEIIEFNVPVSTSNGTPQHPGAESQYIVNNYEYHDNGLGDDWIVFDVYNNIETGLQPIQFQNDYFIIEAEDSYNNTEVFRITGCGVDGPSPYYGSNGNPKNSDSQTQQTETGDFHSLVGNILRYEIDTMGGNSGSPIIRVSNGKAVGIHTDGGCTSSGGNNKGTNLTNDDLWDAIYDADIKLTNRLQGDNQNNLNGTLSLDNLITPQFDYYRDSSGFDAYIVIGDPYTTKTYLDVDGDAIHKQWAGEEDFLLGKNIESIEEQNINAWYDFRDQVTITASLPVSLQLHDPWYLENPEADPSDWNQPDAFRPLNEQLNSSGNINVFLNQNPNFLPDLPIYRIKAPAIGETTQNDIFVFSHWAAHEDIDYGNGINTISNDLETDVVFKDVNAEVIAVYSPASELPNYTLTIEQGETLTIPSGSEITFAEGFKIIVEGELDFQATVEAPITLKGVADERWAGIEVMPSSYWNPSHIIFKDAETAIKMDNVEPASIFNCQFENCGTGLELSKSIFTVSNNSFRHSSGIRVFSSNGITIADINNNDFNNCSIGVMADGSATIRVNRNVFSQDSYGMASIITSINPYSTNRIINNTIVGNPNQTMGMALYSPDVEVKNNIIINCERGITSTFLPTNCEDNPFVLSDGFNNIWGNELNYCNIYPSETDVSVDPLLNSNHQLTENSPCIDAGDPDSPLDPDGTMADMGAFYFDNVPSPPSGFTILGDVGDHPELTWDEHEESDVNEFFIYRSLNYGAFLLTATVSQTNWVDTEVTINNEKKFSNRACYTIKAVDAITQESPSTSPQCESVDIGLKKQAFTLIPKEYEWSSAHPNPFNPTTTIQYGLPVSSHITFTIHNMLGQLVKTIHSKNIPAGVHSIQWNSLNNAGEKVPSDMYIVQMKAISTNAKKHFTNSQKVVLLK